MNETLTDYVKDARKKRREYLARKVKTGSASVAFAVVTVYGLILCLISLTMRQNGPWQNMWGLFAALIGSGGVVCCYLSYIKANEMKAIPFVPPVAEQIAALPAEAILVRGADEPAASPGELLRAARAGEETEAGELLRPS